MEQISSSSIFSLFNNADLVVKLIIGFLFLLSVISWTIIFDKFLKFSLLISRTNKFEDLFDHSDSIEEILRGAKKRRNHPFALMFIVSMSEWRSSLVNELKKNGDYHKIKSLKERIESEIYVTSMRSSKKMEKGLNFLAIIGSTSPFVGLFGTVWGIMNSFQGIAISKNTSLAVVAPGIAEALLATGIGLFAAIPAVFFYNIFSAKINDFHERAEGFSIRLQNMLSKELDRGA